MTINSDPSSNPPNKRRHALFTLRHREFRFLWLGLLISTVGLQVQQVGVAWHMYLLTGSVLQVGLIGLFGAIPFMAMSLVGGTVADRANRKTVLLITQSSAMVFAGILAVATAVGFVAPWLIYLMQFLTGASTAFDNPARQAIVPHIVPREELSNAFALNSLLRQTAGIVGPGIGGLIIGRFGVTAAYATNSISFLAVIVALLTLRSLPVIEATSKRGLAMIVEGLHYARSRPVILGLLTLDFLVVGLGSYRALLPVFAKDVLDIGPEGLGLLQSAPALGAVVGATLMGAMGRISRPALLVLGTSAVYGLCVAAFGVSRILPLSLSLLFVAGFSDVIGEVQRATVIQLLAPEAMRGRLASFQQLFSQGGPQLGQLWSGSVASVVGPGLAAVIGGSSVVLVVARYSMFPFMRSRHMDAEDPRPVAPRST